MSEIVPYREGHWMVRVVRDGPEVCAKIALEWTEPGEPDNRMDRPHWQGQIGLDLTPPHDIWSMLEYCESTPEQQLLLSSPPEVERAPRNGRRPALAYAPLAKWKQARARRITTVQYAIEIKWLTWAKKFRPDAPELNPNRAIDKRAMPPPRFK